MRTLINIVVIVGVGLVVGLGVRYVRNQSISEVAEEESANLPADVGFIDAERPTKIDPPPKPELDPGDDWLQSFELTERSGETVTSASLKGQPYVASFFFTLCPSICVTQNQKLAELQEAFAGQDVKFLSISVDAENDDPEALREYAARFGADPDQWLFLTSQEPNYVQRVGAEMFQVSANLQHTERFILMNAEGEMEGYYMWSDPRSFERLKRDLAAMLEGEEQAGRAS